MKKPRRANCTILSAIDEPTLRELQSSLALSSRAAVAVVDGTGRCRFDPTPGNDFSRVLASTEAGVTAQRARFEAAAAGIDPNGERWTTDAAVGLGHLVIPVAFGKARPAAVVVGDRPLDGWSESQARLLAEQSGVDAQALLEAAGRMGDWAESDRRAAASLATLLASMLVRLCKQERQLHNRVEELSAVYNMADMLAGRHGLQELLDRTARKICEVTQTKACSIRLLDEQSGELVIKAVHNLSDRYLQKGPVHVEDHPIDIEALKGRVVYIEDVPNDPRVQYPDEARREGIVSGLVCGMLHRGRSVGVIRIYSDHRQRFSEYDKALLRALAAQTAAAIVNARLYHAAIDAERYERQLHYAGDVQRRMIPVQPPKSARAEFGCVYAPSREVGGDFYDFIELPGGNIGIAIADVVGKGLPAALTMASLRSALRVYTYHVYDVDRIMTKVNDHLVREMRANEFATVFYGVITPDGRRLTYCNAGHEYPLLLRDGKVQSLEAGGLAMGVLPNATFEKEILDLRPGDVLLLYTDGCVESMNFAEVPFGRDGLRASFLRHAHLPPGRMINNILWDVRRFLGFSELVDDMTMVAARIQ